MFGIRSRREREQREKDKHEERMEKIKMREERIEERGETKRDAYEHGIDPNASTMGMVTSLGKDVAGVFETGMIAKQGAGVLKDAINQAGNQAGQQQPQMGGQPPIAQQQHEGLFHKIFHALGLV